MNAIDELIWTVVRREGAFVKMERRLEVGWWHQHGNSERTKRLIDCYWVGDEVKCTACGKIKDAESEDAVP